MVRTRVETGKGIDVRVENGKGGNRGESLGNPQGKSTTTNKRRDGDGDGRLRGREAEQGESCSYEGDERDLERSGWSFG